MIRISLHRYRNVFRKSDMRKQFRKFSTGQIITNIRLSLVMQGKTVQ